MLNSIKDEYVEVLKKYNLDEKEIKANNTLDKFLLFANNKEKIDKLENNNGLENVEDRLSDNSDFDSSDYSSDEEINEEEKETDIQEKSNHNENYNIFSSRKFIYDNC